MTKKHYVLELKLIEVENETTEVYNSTSRTKENVKTGQRTTKDILNVHLTADHLHQAIEQAGEHLRVVHKSSYPDLGGSNPTASDNGYSYSRPIKDNPQA